MASAHYNLALQEFWKGTLGDLTSARDRGQGAG